MSEVSDLFNELIQETGWWPATNDSDCIESPDEEQCAAARSNFEITYEEEVLFIRDTGFWNNFDQGLVITDENIYCIPDNDVISRNFSIRWCDINTVTYKDNVLYFWDDSEELASIHISYFVKDEDDYDVGDEIAEMLDEIAKSVEDPSDVALYEINKLLEQEDYLSAIAAAKRAAIDYPVYSLFFKNKMAGACYKAKKFAQCVSVADEVLAESEYGSDPFTRAAYWKYAANKATKNYFEARKDALVAARFAGDDWMDGDKSMKEIAEEDFDNFNALYSEHFLELPYKERKTLLVVDTIFDLHQSNLAVLESDSDFSNFNFPMGHPKVNEVYVGHPLLTNKYMPIETYQLELVEDRVREFCMLAQSLGATEISIECLNASSNNRNVNSKNSLSGEAGYGFLDGKVGINNDFSSSMIEHLSHSINLHQTFAPTKSACVPDGLVWYDSESSWQRLVKQRFEGGLLSHEERIETKSSQILEGKELTNVKAEVEAIFADLEVAFDKSEELKFQSQNNAVLSIKVKFAPLDSLTGSAVPQTQNLLSENEEEYMNMLRESLEDGTISAGERRLLDRFKLKLGISDARAQELEDSLTKPNLTDDELEYLNEVKESKRDGEISAGERRLLEKLRKMLNITEERAKEIENMVPVQVTLEAPKTNFKSVYTREDYKKWRDENCSSAPTKNQIMMYLGAGVYWDDGAAGDNQQTYTLPNGRTYHKGLWVMKKEYISGFSAGSAKAINNTIDDSSCFHEGRPAKSEIGKYFFLPAAGCYDDGDFYDAGSFGYYWSSSPNGGGSAYRLYFGSSKAFVIGGSRGVGYLPMVAE